MFQFVIVLADGVVFVIIIILLIFVLFYILCCFVVFNLYVVCKLRVSVNEGNLRALRVEIKVEIK